MKIFGYVDNQGGAKIYTWSQPKAQASPYDPRDYVCWPRGNGHRQDGEDEPEPRAVMVKTC